MESNTPLLSIIIPAYNSEETLERTVLSIQSQNFDSYEIIIVNDGSLDNTEEVANRIAREDSRVRVYHQDNSGVSVARNNGLSHMSVDSQFFTFVDSDDILINDIYPKALCFLTTEEGIGIDILTFSCRAKDYKGQSKDFVLPEETVSSLEAREVISIDNVRYGGGYIWNRIVRRSYYDRNPVRFREDICLYEDKLWLLDLMAIDGRAHMWPELGYEYCVRDRENSPRDYLEYMIGLRAIVDCGGLSLENDLVRKIRYAESFSKALSYATDTGHGEMQTLLNEWFHGETEELKRLLSITHKRLSEVKVSYVSLGDSYLEVNKKLAYLCYENALYLGEDGAKSKLASLEQIEDGPRNVSIVILSYNTLEKTKECIESIRATTPQSAVEIVVVDNNSKDGSLLWLRQQDDIVLVENKENRGFPGGCNDGIAASNPQNDIFLLNSDTIVTKNALFTLRMGLYSSEDIGAAGCMANNAVEAQKIKETFGSIKKYLDFAVKQNVVVSNAIEYKNWLMGFAVIIRRDVLEKTGYLDERFNPGNYEDDDLGLRIGLLGYKNALCHNSLIYHYGSESFKSNQGMDSYNSLSRQNFDKYTNKWGYEPSFFTHIREDLVELIEKAKEETFSVLEIGCLGGNTLSRISYDYPDALVFGTEKDEMAIKLAGLKFPCKRVDDYLEIPFSGPFDVVILDETLSKVDNPGILLRKVKSVLAPEGEIICSVPNSRYGGESGVQYPRNYDEILDMVSSSELKIKGDMLFIADNSKDCEDIHERIVQYIFKCS